MSSVQPYDLNSLAGGSVRVVYAPIAAPVPANLGTVQKLESPYTLQGSSPNTWLDFGATTGPFQYSRNLTTAGFNIEQTSSAVLETPQETVRTIQVPIGEIRPETLKIIEEAPSTGLTTAATGLSVQKTVAVGTINDLTQYRIAFIGRRMKAQGLVTESSAAVPASGVRGRFLAFVSYRAQLSAENVQVSFGRGNLATASVTFKLFPEPTITVEGQEYGIWFDEQSGTIT